MKVTISFDGTKIVVPCGDGDITVRELINLAVTRYKKVIGKPSHFWVSVSNLKSCVEGGMLDPDDLVSLLKVTSTVIGRLMNDIFCRSATCAMTVSN